MKTRKIIFVLLCLSVTGIASAQIKRNTLVLPEVDGYELLKCDFHMHTVFSDGEVWPTIRVDEAFAEGLDAIAISDHVENTRIMQSIGTEVSMNTSYDLAEKAAATRDIILIKACEISKDLPAGHYNALFVKDVDAFRPFIGKENKNDPSMIRGALEEARKQGATVLWNHPWSRQKNQESYWSPTQDSLYNDGLFQGVSVGNGARADLKVLKWCLDKNLTVYSNTDAHTPISLESGQYRNMTIVFAKKRSAEGIRQALENRMTVAYFRDHLYGKKELIKKIADNSLEMESFMKGNRRAYIIIRNKTGLTFDLTQADNGGLKMKLDRMSGRSFTVEPFSDYAIEVDVTKISQAEKNGDTSLSGPHKVTFSVTNLHIGQDECYQLDIPVNF